MILKCLTNIFIQNSLPKDIFLNTRSGKVNNFDIYKFKVRLNWSCTAVWKKKVRKTKLLHLFLIYEISMIFIWVWKIRLYTSFQYTGTRKSAQMLWFLFMCSFCYHFEACQAQACMTSKWVGNNGLLLKLRKLASNKVIASLNHSSSWKTQASTNHKE